jgi:hypothetical protein
MGIPDLVRRKVRNPDGGIGGLTVGEEAELSDLVNSGDRLCECGRCGCGSPLLEPKRFLQ